MIIREVTLKQRLFFCDQVVILTDNNKISIDTEWSENFVYGLNSKLKNFRIDSADDFVAMRGLLKDVGEDKYSIFEDAIIKNIKKAWSFFDSNAKQVPRPMNVVFRKESGIKEFIVFSLNARNFPIALEANRHVADRLQKRIKSAGALSENDLLLLAKESMDEEHSLIEFELRLGATFDNYNNGEYIYSDKTFTKEEQFEFVSKLIDKYNLVYVENPFSNDDLISYKKLANKYRKKSLICLNLKTSNYADEISRDSFNCVVAQFNNFADFKSSIDLFKDKKLNIILDGSEIAMDAAVGLGIPLVKLWDEKKSDAAARRLMEISEEILLFRSSETKP